MTQEQAQQYIRHLLKQLLPATRGFSRICDTDPCRSWGHYHFDYPDTIPEHMTSTVDIAYEIYELGRDLGDVIPTDIETLQVWTQACHESLDGLRALGIIRVHP